MWWAVDRPLGCLSPPSPVPCIPRLQRAPLIALLCATQPSFGNAPLHLGLPSPEITVTLHDVRHVIKRLVPCQLPCAPRPAPLCPLLHPAPPSLLPLPLNPLTITLHGMQRFHEVPLATLVDLRLEALPRPSPSLTTLPLPPRLPPLIPPSPSRSMMCSTSSGASRIICRKLLNSTLGSCCCWPPTPPPPTPPAPKPCMGGNAAKAGGGADCSYSPPCTDGGAPMLRALMLVRDRGSGLSMCHGTF